MTMDELDSKQDLKALDLIRDVAPTAALPVVPDDWDCRVSIEKMRTLAGSAQTLKKEIAEELYIARQKYHSPGFRMDLVTGDVPSLPRTWREYCKFIGLSVRKADRWIEKTYPALKNDSEPDNPESDDPESNDPRSKGKERMPEPRYRFRLSVGISADHLEGHVLELTDGVRGRIAQLIAEDVIAEAVIVGKVLEAEYAAPPVIAASMLKSPAEARVLTADG